MNSTKQTVVIFSTAYLPFVGGAEIAIKEITDRIKNTDFFLITSRMRRFLPKKERIGNIIVYRLGLGFSFDKFLLPLLGFFKFFKLYNNWKNASWRSIFPKRSGGGTLEIGNWKLVLWGVMSSYAGIAAYFVKLWQPKIPFLLTLQEGDSEKHLKWGKLGLVGFFGKRVIKKANYIQVISVYLKEFAIKRAAKTRGSIAGVNTQAPIEIVPNGVDVNKLKIKNEKLKIIIQNLKEKLNIKPEEKVIITVSRLVHKNAVDVIIDAFNILQTTSHPDKKSKISNGASKLKAKLLVVGDGLLRKELELKAKSYKLKAIFVGAVPPDEVNKYLAVSDIFVRPSRSEGLGNAFLEAMAMAVPVIGTPVGGIPDFLIDGETGLFCKVNDPKDLAEKIKILLENNDLRERIIKNAKKLVEEKYDWVHISRKMEKIFANLSTSFKS